jgi:hypothetical protein
LAESLGDKGGGDMVGGMDEQLSFHAMETRSLLESADCVIEQFQFDVLATVVSGIGVFDEQVSDYAFGSLVHEKAITMDAPTLNGRKTRKNSRVGVAENHVCRGAVIPVESVLPDGYFLFHKRAKVRGSKVAKVEYLHEE